MALAGAAIIGTVAAAASYVDAKYHITQDLATIREQRQIGQLVQSRVKANKLSLWYDFEAQATRLRDETSIWYRTVPTEPAVTYTWTEVYQQSCRWAHFLLENGVQPGELVGTYLQNSPEYMFSLLGLWAIGCAPAMINYHLSGDGLISCLRIAGSKLLLVDEDSECRGRVEEVRSRIENELGMRIIIIDNSIRARIAATDAKRPEDSFRDGVIGTFPIFLFYTSGTTGFPKACALQTQRAFPIGFPRLRTTGLKPGPGGDVWYDCMPLYHGTGCTTAITCMMTGVTLAVGRRFSVRNFWHDIHDSGANAFVYVGETARYLLAAPLSPLDRGHKLKCMYGNGLRPDVWQKFQERFDISCVNEFFNSTEGVFMLLNVCRGPFNVGHVGHHGAIIRSRLHDSYVPVQIDHENGERIWRDVKTGFATRTAYEDGGEIIVKCNTEADFCGYWRNPEATGKRFERDVFKKGDLYYRTGDALRRDKDGRWFFMDRLGDTFRWKSENVSTAQVAEVLGQFPGIVEANVYGVEVPSHDGRAGCAAVYIRPDERQRFDFASLVVHMRKTLPKYAVPLFLRVIKSPTPMHNNKQNKVPLRKEGVDLDKIRTGEAGPEDLVLWLKPGTNTFTPFTEQDWQALVAGKARL